MASLQRTKRRKTLKVEKPLHMSPVNNRKSTRGRVVQIDPDTGRKIIHR
jgi:hypothetical protein